MELLTVGGKYGRKKEAERFGKELEVGVFFSIYLICNLGNIELENSLRVRLLVNPGHLELSRHCKTRGS